MEEMQEVKCEKCGAMKVVTGEYLVGPSGVETEIYVCKKCEN